MRLERHDPVNEGEGSGEDEHHQSRRAQCAHFPDEPLIAEVIEAGAVLRSRPLTQQIRVQEPDGEVEDRTADKKGNVQVCRLTQNVRVLRRLGTRPCVENGHAEQDWN